MAGFPSHTIRLFLVPSNLSRKIHNMQKTLALFGSGVKSRLTPFRPIWSLLQLMQFKGLSDRFTWRVVVNEPEWRKDELIISFSCCKITISTARYALKQMFFQQIEIVFDIRRNRATLSLS